MKKICQSFMQPVFSQAGKNLKMVILVPKEEMGGPASRNRFNEFSMRMAHRQYYLNHNMMNDFGFKVFVKFYMEGKLNKFLDDENNQWVSEKYVISKPNHTARITWKL